MTDQITEYVARKLTGFQKRGSTSHYDMSNDKRGLQIPVHARSAEELKAAQRGLAEMALTQPEPEVWLRDVLEALGLLRQVTVKKEPKEMCGIYQGTMRGYELHLRAYSRPCNMCDAVARSDENARLARLGIKYEESGTWAISTS